MTLLNLFHGEPHPQSFKQGHVIIHEGERGHLMYVVLDGYVEITIRGQLLDVLGPGGFFGEMALVDQGTRCASARARSDCRLAAVDRARFQFLVADSPDFALEVMKTMAHRLRREMQLSAT